MREKGRKICRVREFYFLNEEMESVTSKEEKIQTTLLRAQIRGAAVKQEITLRGAALVGNGVESCLTMGSRDEDGFEARVS